MKEAAERNVAYLGYERLIKLGLFEKLQSRLATWMEDRW